MPKVSLSTACSGKQTACRDCLRNRKSPVERERATRVKGNKIRTIVTELHGTSLYFLDMEIRDAHKYSPAASVAQNVKVATRPIGNNPTHTEQVETFSRDSYEACDASSQRLAEQQRSLKLMALKNGHSRVGQPQVRFGGGPKGGPYKHDWNNSFHQNNRPEDADLRCNVAYVTRPVAKKKPVQVQKKTLPQPRPARSNGQSRPTHRTMPTPLKLTRGPAPHETAGIISRPNVAYPPNDPISRNLLQKNITEASVLSAQTRNSDMREQAWESMLVNQKIDDSSNLHYFNLGATGAAFHFDVDALVKYAGHNHNLITPEQAALVRRGYVFASAKPK